MRQSLFKVTHVGSYVRKKIFFNTGFLLSRDVQVLTVGQGLLEAQRLHWLFPREFLFAVEVVSKREMCQSNVLTSHFKRYG